MATWCLDLKYKNKINELKNNQENVSTFSKKSLSFMF